MSQIGGLGLSSTCVAAERPTALLGRIRRWISEANPGGLLHPLGFWVVLLQRDGVEEWRFHFWPRGQRTITGMPAPIHTHNKVVQSKVLFGKIANMIYDTAFVSSGGLPIYEVAYVGDKYTPRSTNVLMRSDERAVPIPASNELIASGQTYSIPAHVYHESIVPE